MPIRAAEGIAYLVNMLVKHRTGSIIKYRSLIALASLESSITASSVLFFYGMGALESIGAFLRAARAQSAERSALKFSANGGCTP